MLLPLQGVKTMAIVTQGVASLALGYVLLPLQVGCSKSALFLCSKYPPKTPHNLL